MGRYFVDQDSVAHLLFPVMPAPVVNITRRPVINDVLPRPPRSYAPRDLEITPGGYVRQRSASMLNRVSVPCYVANGDTRVEYACRPDGAGGQWYVRRSYRQGYRGRVYGLRWMRWTAMSGEPVGPLVHSPRVQRAYVPAN